VTQRFQSLVLYGSPSPLMFSGIRSCFLQKSNLRPREKLPCFLSPRLGWHMLSFPQCPVDDAGWPYSRSEGAIERQEYQPESEAPGGQLRGWLPYPPRWTLSCDEASPWSRTIYHSFRLPLYFPTARLSFQNGHLKS